MTHAELYAITAQGPAVIMVARDDMLALLDRAERAEAGIAAAVEAERDACTTAVLDAGCFGGLPRHLLTPEFGQPRFDMMRSAVSAIRARGTP